MHEGIAVKNRNALAVIVVLAAAAAERLVAPSANFGVRVQVAGYTSAA